MTKNENEIKPLKNSKNQYEKENDSMKMRLQLEIFDQNKSCILKHGRNIILCPKSVMFSIKYN